MQSPLSDIFRPRCDAERSAHGVSVFFWKDNE